MKALVSVLAGLLLVNSATASPLTNDWPISIRDFSDSWVELYWDDQPCGTEPFTVQMREAGIWVTIATEPWSANIHRIEDLSSNTSYEFRVFVAGIESVEVSVTTAPAFTGPLGLTVQNQNDVVVSWTAQAGATGYYIEWFRDDGTSLFPPPTGNQTINNGNATTATFTNLQVGDNYLFRMHALLPGDARTGWIEGYAQTGVAAPQGFNARRTATVGHIELTWLQVRGADQGYELQRSEHHNQNYQPLTTISSYFVTSFLDNSADPGKRYYYRIRSVENPFDQSAWSIDDVWVSLPPPPGSLVATDISDTTVTLGWSALPGIETYDISRSEFPFTSWETVGQSGLNEFIDGLAGNAPVFPGNTYRYRVRGRTGDPILRNTSWSSTLEVVTPPANPSPATAVLLSGPTIRVGWANVFGETGYQIERRSAVLIGSLGNWVLWSNRAANTTSWVDSSVSASRRYQYRVRSVNAQGESSWAYSPIVSTSSGVPVNLNATPGSSTDPNSCATVITLTWDVVAGATGYVVERSRTNGLQFQSFVINGGSNTTLIDTGLTPFTVYRYRVKSTSGGPDSSFGGYHNEWTCAWLNANPPDHSVVNLTWTDMTNQSVQPVSEYRVERASAYGSWTEIATVHVLDGPAYADTDVFPDSAYAYRIRGWYAAGGGNFTAYSMFRLVTTNPPPITGFALTDCDDTSFSFQWDPALSVNVIQILRRQPSDSGWTIIATLPGTYTTWTDSPPTPDASWSYWIIGNNSNGDTSGTAINNLVLKFPLTVTNLAPNTALVDWSAVTHPAVPDHYRVERDTGSGWQFVADTSLTNRKVGGNCTGTEFRVIAMDAANQPIRESVVETFTATPVPAPDSINTTVLSSSSVEITWDDEFHAKGFWLERKEGAAGTWFVLGNTPDGVTTFTDTLGTPGTTYYYRVYSRDPCGVLGDSIESGPTTVWTIIQEWRVGYWGSGSSVLAGTGNYGNDADFDHDGCLNIFEFFHDTDPTNSLDCTAPVVVVRPSPGGLLFEVIWPVRDDTGGVLSTIELSGDLQFFDDWEDVTGATTFAPTGTIGVRIPENMPINGIFGQKYARLVLSGY